MNGLLALFALTASIEAVWEMIKPAWPRVLTRLEKERGVPVDRLGTLLLAVAACSAVNFDLPASCSIPFPLPYLGTLLTGILAGRGSHLWHDLLGTLDGIRRDKKPIEPEGTL